MNAQIDIHSHILLLFLFDVVQYSYWWIVACLDLIPRQSNLAFLPITQLPSYGAPLFYPQS